MWNAGVQHHNASIERGNRKLKQSFTDIMDLHDAAGAMQACDAITPGLKVETVS